MIEYILKRSKRRTVALYIRNDGLEVRALLKFPKRDIDNFVASKEKWIMDKLTKSNGQSARREEFFLEYGSLVIYRGKQYPIQAGESKRAGFDSERFYMPPNLTPEHIKDVCVQIYHVLAKQHLTERTFTIAQKMNVIPIAVKINSASTRWGSCSAKKSINFSWRLVMASDEIIDYVVVHELAHIIEMNHSKKFWSAVENVLPDYRKNRMVMRIDKEIR